MEAPAAALRTQQTGFRRSEVRKPPLLKQRALALDSALTHIFQDRLASRNHLPLAFDCLLGHVSPGLASLALSKLHSA